MKALALASAVLGAMSVPWCQPTTPPNGAGAEPEPAPAPAALPEAERGEPLEATIPLYGEGVATLAQMRGRVVVVEFFSPAEPDWAVAHEPWRALRAAHPEDVEIVAVATASSDTGLVDRWDSASPEHVIGWDPEGALALRLGIDGLPTVLVLDRQGRRVASGPDRDSLRATAKSLF